MKYLEEEPALQCLLLPSILDAQFGTPYPRSAGFDTDSGRNLRHPHAVPPALEAALAGGAV